MKPLRITRGPREGSLAQVVVRGGEMDTGGLVERWERVGLLTGDGEACWVLEPAPERQELRHGDLVVEGGFRVVDRAEGRELVRLAWAAFLGVEGLGDEETAPGVGDGRE